MLKKVLPRSVITSEDGEALPEETAEEAPADEAPAEAELSLFEKLEALGINTAEGMGYCMDDEELYSELLMQFVNEAPSKRLLMEEAFAAEDLKNYAIYVHGLKSTSRMIGGGALGSQAEALEFASKDGNAEFVREHHPGLMEDYLNLTEGISQAYGTVPSSEDPEKGGE